MSIKKSGIPFPVYVSTKPPRNIPVEDISVKYRVSGSSDDYVEFPGSFAPTGEQLGKYVLMCSIGTVGYYEILIAIAESADQKFPAEEILETVTVLNATNDDIFNQLTTTDSKITSIKTQVDLLNSETVNNISATLTEVDEKIQTLTELVNDVDDPAIKSLRELLVELGNTTGGSDTVLTAIDTFIRAAVDDVEFMLNGADTLTDGTPNPFKGNTNIDIMNKLTSVNEFIGNKMDTLKSSINASVTASKDELLGVIGEVKTIVTSNADSLTNDVHGLPAIIAKLTATEESLTTTVSSISDDLTTVKDVITTLNTGVNEKLDSIKTDTTDIVTKLNEQTTTNVIM